MPDRNGLKLLSDDFSVDFAALYFANQIVRMPINRRFRSIHDQAYEYTSKAFPKGDVELPATATEYEVLVVPIYPYERLLGAGADLAVPRATMEKIGLTCHFVETQDDGPVEAYADLVAAAIRARAESGRRLIVVSASKSSAEVALALTRLGRANTGHVAAWINTAGVLQGTPLMGERLFKDLELLVGQIDAAGKESLTTARGRQRFNSFDIPERAFVVNYVGIPITGSVSFFARRGFVFLRKLGPNDGISLVADTIIPAA